MSRLYSIRIVSLVGLLALLALPASAKAPAGRFIVATSGHTVKDTLTGLTWQRDGSASGRVASWAAAKSYCQALSLEGSGWRLPNIVELLSIVDRAEVDPAIDATAFPSTPGDWFWSSTGFQGGSSSAWIVDFSDGDSSIYGVSIDSSFRARCVR